VFVKPPGGWTDGTETARLASPGGAYTQFGSSVGIAGNTVVVGAPATQAENADNAKGVVYVFVKPAGGWADEPYTALLTPPDAEQRDNLGTSVAISGNTIVAGAPQLPYHPFETPHRNGKAYAFVSPNGGWTTGTQVTKLTASDGAPGDGFGSFVGVSGDSVVVGAPGADISGNTNQGAAYAFGEVSATIVLKKQLAPSSDAGRFDLKVGQTVVKAGAGNGGFGSLEVLPGTYRVSESAVAGASLSSYASSIACTLNGNPGPSADGTTKLDVTVAKDDVLACTFTNKRRAQIALTKHLTPADDAGRFDLKVAATVVKSGAGDGDSGSTQVGAGSYSLSEVAAAGTSLTSYASSIACTRNGAAGPSGNGASLKVTVGWGDVLACTITNQRGAAIKLVKQLAPGSDPGRFDLKVGGTVVKAGAGNGGSGSLGVPAGTYRVAEGAAPGTSLSDYATAIACTLNGSPGPSASGTTQLDVTVAVGDVLTCTITNKHKVQVTLLKHLVPSSDPGRFDLKLSSSTQVKVVKAGAGDGDSGSVQVAPGTWTVQESAAPGTSLSDYTSSIACTRNGNAGPSGNAASLPLTLAASDVVVCTITNRRT
jgi:hypothetical protein